MNKPTFVYETYIDTTAEKLWKALTSPEFTEKYWGGRRIQSEWKKGASIKFIKPDGEYDWQGQVLEAQAPELLSYSWGSEEDESIKVKFELEPYGSVMRLRVTHEFESEIEENIRGGWIAIISSLKSLLETGTALTYPWKG